MSEIALEFDGIWKKFKKGEIYDSLRDLIPALTRGVFSRNHRGELEEREFWALRDVSFQVRRGEVLGIIGANGAGKSTVLKLLSRIMHPNRGRIITRGRISSLIEVGAGFHPDLTGRENVYLNGSILGMKRQEITRKFDEIVEFAGIGDFIDTPVKRYSSGMYARLGFAVAAHVDPDILIVDEVLSVGDAAFQSKCLGKMRDVASGGRTVVFVSHNMGGVTQLCERAIWLDQGQIKLTGDPSKVVSEYLSRNRRPQSEWINPSDGAGRQEAWIKSIRLLTDSDEPASTVDYDRGFKVEISYQIATPSQSLVILCRLVDSRGATLWTSWDTDSTDLSGRMRAPGEYFSICRVPGSLVRPGRYHLTVGAYIPGARATDFHEGALSFDVSSVGYRMNSDRVGVVTPVRGWEVFRAPEGDSVATAGRQII